MRTHRVNSSLSSAAAAAAAADALEAAVAGPGVEHMERALSPWMLDGADGAALRATTVYLDAATAHARRNSRSVWGLWCAVFARGEEPVAGWVLFDCELG